MLWQKFQPQVEIWFCVWPQNCSFCETSVTSPNPCQGFSPGQYWNFRPIPRNMYADLLMMGSPQWCQKTLKTLTKADLWQLAFECRISTKMHVRAFKFPKRFPRVISGTTINKGRERDQDGKEKEPPTEILYTPLLWIEKYTRKNGLRLLQSTVCTRVSN